MRGDAQAGGLGKASAGAQAHSVSPNRPSMACMLGRTSAIHYSVQRAAYLAFPWASRRAVEKVPEGSQEARMLATARLHGGTNVANSKGHSVVRTAACWKWHHRLPPTHLPGNSRGLLLLSPAKTGEVASCASQMATARALQLGASRGRTFREWMRWSAAKLGWVERVVQHASPRDCSLTCRTEQRRWGAGEGGVCMWGRRLRGR